MIHDKGHALIGKLGQVGGKPWTFQMYFEMQISIAQLLKEGLCPLFPKIRYFCAPHKVPSHATHAGAIQLVKFVITDIQPNHSDPGKVLPVEPRKLTCTMTPPRNPWSR